MILQSLNRTHCCEVRLLLVFCLEGAVQSGRKEKEEVLVRIV